MIDKSLSSDKGISKYTIENNLKKGQFHHVIVEGFQPRFSNSISNNNVQNNLEGIDNRNIEWFQFDSTMTKIECYYSPPTSNGKMLKNIIDPKDYNCRSAEFTAMYGSTHPKSNIDYNGRVEYTSMVISIDKENRCFCTLTYRASRKEGNKIHIYKDERHVIDIAALVEAQYGSSWNVLHQNVTEYIDENNQMYYYLSYTKKDHHGFLIITYNVHGELILIEDHVDLLSLNGDKITINQHNQTLLDISIIWSDSLIQQGHVTILTTNYNGDIESSVTNFDDKLNKVNRAMYCNKVINKPNKPYLFNGVKSWGYNICTSSISKDYYLHWPENDSVMKDWIKYNQHDYLFKIKDIVSTDIHNDLWNMQKQKFCSNYNGSVISLDFSISSSIENKIISKVSKSDRSDEVMPFLAQFDDSQINKIYVINNQAGFIDIFFHDSTGGLWIASQLGDKDDNSVLDKYEINPMFKPINGMQTPIFSKAIYIGKFDMVYVPYNLTEGLEYAYIKDKQVFLAQGNHFTKSWVSSKLGINATIS